MPHNPLEIQQGYSSAVVNLLHMPARTQATQHTKTFHQWVSPNGALWAQFYRMNMGYLIRFPLLADFLVSADGNTVTCFPSPGAANGASEHLYLNQILPLVLSRQGNLVFHASAVEVGDAAVAFVANSGRGKSTLAASFATSGFRFLTDDGLEVRPCTNGYQVLPSHPSIRLWEDSQEALVGAGALAAPPLDFTSKARFLAGDVIAFCSEARPLHRVYFLGDGTAEETSFKRMSASEAFVELVRHSFLLDIEEHATLASHFGKLSKLVSQPIFFRLDYPRRFAEIARLRQAIVLQANE